MSSSNKPKSKRARHRPKVPYKQTNKTQQSKKPWNPHQLILGNYKHPEYFPSDYPYHKSLPVPINEIETDLHIKLNSNARTTPIPWKNGFVVTCTDPICNEGWKDRAIWTGFNNNHQSVHHDEKDEIKVQIVSRLQHKKYSYQRECSVVNPIKNTFSPSLGSLYLPLSYIKPTTYYTSNTNQSLIMTTVLGFAGMQHLTKLAVPASMVRDIMIWLKQEEDNAFWKGKSQSQLAQKNKNTGNKKQIDFPRKWLFKSYMFGKCVPSYDAKKIENFKNEFPISLRYAQRHHMQKKSPSQLQRESAMRRTNQSQRRRIIEIQQTNNLDSQHLDFLEIDETDDGETDVQIMEETEDEAIEYEIYPNESDIEFPSPPQMIPSPQSQITPKTYSNIPNNTGFQADS